MINAEADRSFNFFGLSNFHGFPAAAGSAWLPREANIDGVSAEILPLNRQAMGSEQRTSDISVRRIIPVTIAKSLSPKKRVSPETNLAPSLAAVSSHF
jgi:hypothetical protein